MNSIYANGFQIQMNELPRLDFMDSTNGNQNIVVARMTVTYENLRLFNDLINQVLEQHDKKLHEVQRSKAGMN